MPRIVRHEFMGNWLVFAVLCLTGLGIPFAILYLLNYTIRIESDIDDPEKFVQQYRSGKLR